MNMTPEARAANRAAEAAQQESEAEGELPPPELMLELWGVPVKEPYAIDRANMIRIAVEQELTAPGQRSSLRRAASLRGEAMRADGAVRSRALALRLAHARLDQHGALNSHRVHLVHLQVSERTLTLARARHAAGGSLQDVTMAEVETARARALVVADEQRALTSQLLAEALRGAGALEPTRERPELVALRKARDAELAQADAERTRNGWFAPRIGASYFPPSGGMDEHSFGVSLGMKLPWLWGRRSGSEHAAAGRAHAMSEELVAKQRDIELEVVEARGAVNAARSSLTVLREQVLPATTRARELAQAAYASGQGRLEQLLQAEAQQVDTEMQIVELETELAHRSADLDFALGRVSAPSTSTEKHYEH
ncbi:MAG TPA: TolC family protein [Polyangiaceae bacterium]